ncbi:WD repeat-containing protein 63 [Blyttiomyces sp. JEL0837]|nr:WD repeat-containing protein 63 [Blyttiomyces sp. JEL0837]
MSSKPATPKDNATAKEPSAPTTAPAPTAAPNNNGSRPMTKEGGGGGGGGEESTLTPKPTTAKGGSTSDSKAPSRVASKVSLRQSSKTETDNSGLGPKRTKSSISVGGDGSQPQPPGTAGLGSAAATGGGLSVVAAENTSPSSTDLNTNGAITISGPSGSIIQQQQGPYEKPPIGEAIAPGNPNAVIPPEGIIPLFLTSMTQDMFKIKTGEDLTVDKPIKIVPKADIVSDIQSRLAISDFHPAKAQILEYPGEEMLLYYDADYKYGQNFFLCITLEAFDAIIRPPLQELNADELLPKPKKPQPKIWESLGTDKEMEAERIENTRDLVHLKVSRKRKEFGGQCQFEDRWASDLSFIELKSFKDPVYEINRMELAIGVQAVPELVHKAAQTNWFRPINFSVQYEPLTMSSEEQKSILETDEMGDFVKSVSTRFEQALQQNAVVNIFLDDFKNLGEEDFSLEQGSHTLLQEFQSFTDLKHSKDKSISCVDWHPTQKGVVAISCTNRATLDEKIDYGFPVRSKQSLLLIWSFHDPIHPQLILEAPDDINCFQFSPSDPNIIAGGCINGQIILWDISEYQDKLKSNRKSKGGAAGTNAAAANDKTEDGGSGSVHNNGGKGGESGGSGDRHAEASIPILRYMAASSIEFSHKSALSDIQWLPSSYLIGHSGEISENAESGNRQLVTCSMDGQVCFWDTRNKKDVKALDLTWKPFLRVPLSAMDNTFDYGLTKVSLKAPLAERYVSETNLAKTPEKTPDSKEKGGEKESPFSSKFFCATEEGDLICSDWIQEKSNEEKASRVEHAFSWHFGPMSDLQRSPFFPDILLSVGGWSFHIWKEKVVAGPLLSSASSSTYLISGRWSPTRPGVFFISKSDGTVEVWDLLDRSHLPTTVQNVSSVGISYMAIHQYPGKGGYQFVAAGDDEGTLHILEIPRNLSKASKNERSIVKAFFDREVKRIHYVSDRKQFRIRERGKWEQSLLEAAAAQKIAAAAASGAAAPAGAKKEEGADAAAAPPAATPAVAPAAGPSGTSDDSDKLEQEYLKMERTFLELEGLLKE